MGGPGRTRTFSDPTTARPAPPPPPAMSAADRELAAKIEGARNSAALGASIAREAEELLSRGHADDAISPLALTSIALSLSGIATVLLATIDDEARR
jgi:hypothetical protein